MTPDDLDRLVRDAERRDQLPPQPLVDLAGGRGAAERYAAMLVSFEEVISRATAQGARSVDIYADTLVLAGGSSVRLVDPLLRTTVIARRIVAGEGAEIVLDHDTEPWVGLRIVAGSLEGDLSITSERHGVRHAYQYPEAPPSTATTPQFVNFARQGEEPAVRQTVVPSGLLIRGEPLHAVLACTFSLVADALATNDDDPTVSETVQAMLRWIAGWAGLESDLAQISHLAEALLGLAPSRLQDGIVHPVPPLTSTAYLSLAQARKNLAEKIASDLALLDQTESIAEMAKSFVGASRRRDAAEAKVIADSAKALRVELDSLDDALHRTSTALRARDLDQKLKEIDLQLAMEHQKITKIVEATFQLAVGLVTLGISIAAILLGAPADPTASAKKDIEGAQGLIEAIKNTRQKAVLGPDTGFTEVLNILRLYLLPVTFSFKDHMEDIKELATSASEIKQAVESILGSGDPRRDLDSVATTLGEALRSLAASPTPLEARAAWDALEVTAVNALDVVLNDADNSQAVKQAASDYKTSVQTLAVYGRLMAEQQAAKNAALRNLGTLGLHAVAQREKAESYASLATEFAERSALKEHVREQIALQQAEAGRDFFHACYGVHRALFYESFTTPASLPSLHATGADAERIYAQLASDVASASRRQMEFDKEIRIRDSGVLEELATGRTVPISIEPDDPNFTGLSGLRLTGLEAWLEGDGLPAVPTRIELLSGRTFRDRHDGSVLQFSGAAWRLPFEYEGRKARTRWSGDPSSVLPSPLTEWLVTLLTPDTVPTPSALRLRLKGKAMA